MCWLMTVMAAVLATIAQIKKPERRLSTLIFMYWGAALMWSVDGIFSVMEGEGFLDLSMNDALLGLLVVVCGLAAFAVLNQWKNKQKSIVNA